MKKTSHIVITRHEQDSVHKWELVNSIVTEWNNNNLNKFFNVGNVLWKIIFTDIKNPEYNILDQKLNNLKEEHAIAYHISINKEIEESDYNTADYIQIFGITLDGLTEPFVLNEEEAFSPETPCPKCGYLDSFSKIQVKPLLINEKLLTHSLEGFLKPENIGWDIINVSGGRILVSKRFVDILQENEAKGFILRKVLENNGIHYSQRVFQIEVEKMILIPYFQLVNPEINAFCDECGASIKMTDKEFNVDKNSTKNADFFSRHPNKSTMLYVSNRIFTILIRANLHGLISNDIVNYNTSAKLDHR